MNNREGKINPAVFGIIIIGLLVLLAFIGCKSVVPVTNTHQKDSVRVEYRHDSIYIYRHDSIFRDRWRAGDTVYITTEKWLTRYRDKLVEIHDTISTATTDTIYQIIETEKKGSAFWKGSGIALWVLLGLLTLGLVIGIIIKFAK